MKGLLRQYHRSFRKSEVTRGYGLLERFLALQRARCAQRLIKNSANRSAYGRVLDIGCGAYPIYLLTSKFMERYGIDKVSWTHRRISKRFTLMNHDIGSGGPLFFEDNFFDAVTMLAVFEHLEISCLDMLFSEIKRILTPGGMFVITTPAVWAEGILRIMAWTGLVSSQEINDHKISLRSPEIREVLKKAGLRNIQSGYFECYLNRWFVAEKP